MLTLIGHAEYDTRNMDTEMQQGFYRRTIFLLAGMRISLLFKVLTITA
jgi:hypothetical protein